MQPHAAARVCLVVGKQALAEPQTVVQPLLCAVLTMRFCRVMPLMASGEKSRARPWPVIPFIDDGLLCGAAEA